MQSYVRVECPACGSVRMLDKQWLGQRGKCIACQADLILSSAGTAHLAPVRSPRWLWVALLLVPLLCPVTLAIVYWATRPYPQNPIEKKAALPQPHPPVIPARPSVEHLLADTRALLATLDEKFVSDLFDEKRSQKHWDAVWLVVAVGGDVIPNKDGKRHDVTWAEAHAVFMKVANKVHAQRAALEKKLRNPSAF